MSSFNAYGTFYLPKEVRAKLHQFNYKNDFGNARVESFKTIKERLLSGATEVRILDKKRFRAKMTGRHFNEAVCCRQFFGIRRMHRLCRAAELLADNQWATAWTLTTCYYAAFFAAIELLHVIGRQVSYFSGEESDDLNILALPSPDTLEKGTYFGVAKYEANTDEVEISYAQTKQKPHEFAWSQLKELIDQTAADTPETQRHRETLLRLLGAGKYPWSRPNDIRNRWNYVDATLFCERGEGVGFAMTERIRDEEDAYAWGGGRNHHWTEQNEAVGLAYLRATLVEAADRVAGAVLPEKLAGKRAA